MKLYAEDRVSQASHFMGHYSNIVDVRKRLVKSMTPQRNVGPCTDLTRFSIRLKGTDVPPKFVRPLSDGSLFARMYRKRASESETGFFSETVHDELVALAEKAD